MKLSDAKHYLPFVQAASEGKIVEVNSGSDQCPKWEHISELNFDREPRVYRIKPTPNLRPWKPEEVPVGALLQDNGKDIGEIFDVGLERFYFRPYYAGRIDYWYMSDAVTYTGKLRYSTDHGKTWLPCGVEECGYDGGGGYGVCSWSEI